MNKTLLNYVAILLLALAGYLAYRFHDTIFSSKYQQYIQSHTLGKVIFMGVFPILLIITACILFIFAAT